jgi:hypothetical protein
LMRLCKDALASGAKTTEDLALHARRLRPVRMSTGLQCLRFFVASRGRSPRSFAPRSICPLFRVDGAVGAVSCATDCRARGWALMASERLAFYGWERG